ncbi:MAG: tetratricopeptide repeat protein [Alphaproteobacteria bacterium]|nr:tetratricopeptide repeat protein [Alphaproteobacteria bacterium]
MVSLKEVLKLNKTNEPKKTLSDHAEDALYREVNEEVHAQETLNFVKQHARALIVIAVIVLVVVASVQIMRHYNKVAKRNAAMSFETAMMMLDNGNPAAASEALARVAAKSSGGMGDLALFNSARIDLQTGNRDNAVSKFEQLAKNGATRDFRDMAIINLAVLKADSMTPAEFEKFLAPLQTKRSPFYYTGLLFVAQKYLSDNDVTNANVWLDRIITDKDAPAAIAAQAEALR